MTCFINPKTRNLLVDLRAKDKIFYQSDNHPRCKKKKKDNMLYTYFAIPKLLQVGGKRLARFIVAKVTRGGAEVIIRFIHRTPESTSDFNTRK